MELIYIKTDDNGVVTSGYLTNYEATFVVSSDVDYVTNTFEIDMTLPDKYEDLYWSENGISTIVFVEGTEFGGEISGSIIDIAANTITYTGRTWRGTMSQYIVEPPAGQDYLIVSGNLKTSLDLLDWNSHIEIAGTSYSGNTFQFDRYITVFTGATSLLTAAQSDLRMAIAFESNGTTGTAVVTIQPTRDLTNLIEVSQDYNDQISLKITRDGNTPKRLICLGQGELKDREVVNLYADDDWNISTTPIPDAYPVEVYDNTGSTTLQADGTKHFKELIHNHQQIEVTINDIDVQLGDVISAKDVLTGQLVSAEITSITWHCSNNGEYQSESYEYRTEVLM